MSKQFAKLEGVLQDHPITPETDAAFPDVPKAPPYEGAKDYFLIEDIDDREQLVKLAQATWEALPEPKPKTVSSTKVVR